MDNVERTQLWNVFNQVTLHSQDARHHRFCLRLMLKHPDNHALYLLNGHTSLVSGTFKHALGMVQTKPFPKAQFWCLLLGSVIYLHISINGIIGGTCAINISFIIINIIILFYFVFSEQVSTCRRSETRRTILFIVWLLVSRSSIWAVRGLS